MVPAHIQRAHCSPKRALSYPEAMFSYLRFRSGFLTALTSEVILSSEVTSHSLNCLTACDASPAHLLIRMQTVITGGPSSLA